MVVLSDFKPTDEFVFYQALIETGIMPNDNQTEVWNNPDSSLHKAWEYFNNHKSRSNIEINNGIQIIDKNIWHKVSGVFTPGGDPCYECPVCHGDRHCYGVEHTHNYHHKCNSCGKELIYPWENKDD